MVALPAVCTRCGHKFQAKGFGEPTLIDAKFDDNFVSCEACGGPAKLVDGVFSTVDGAIDMKSGPQWSLDLINELRIGLAEIVKHPPADSLAAVAEINPPLGAALAEARDAGLEAVGKSESKSLRQKLGQQMTSRLYQFVLGLVAGDVVNELGMEQFARNLAHLCQYVATHGSVPPLP